MDGWIKLHRKILDNPIVCKDSDHIAVWTYLLLNATHKEYPTVFKGIKIILQPGQLITGRKVIAEKFNISESKVQRILKSFEIEQQIEQQNCNKNRLISIISWADYQSSEQQDEHLVNNKRTTTEQQLNTNKNVKNLENLRNTSSSSTDDREITLGDTYTKVCGTIIMPENFRQFFKDVRSQGYTESFCIDLLTEAGDSAAGGKFGLNYLKEIYESWHTQGLGSREEAKQKKEGDKRGKYSSGAEGNRPGGNQKESEYAFLDLQNRTGA
jgi:hypothetical protein